MDMSKYGKYTPAQARERLQWILDVVREHQQLVGWLLVGLSNDDMRTAKDFLADMHKSDRDALLQPNGILTDAQIELLK